MTEGTLDSLALSPTRPRSVTDTINGSHKFIIKGYSLAKGMGVGRHIASDNFTVGGYQWAIYFYPDGKNAEDNSLGYKRFYRRAMLETSDYLKDDSLKINCTVRVFVSIQVPDSDIGQHFGALLDSEEGSDIVFNVSDEKFHAHKLFRAARSPLFQSQLFEDLREDNQEIVISDLEPKVFKALLHSYTETA